MIRRKLLFFMFLGSLAATFSGCHKAVAPVSLAGEAQGTYYSIIYYDDEARNFQKSIDSLLDDFDMTASLWVENSILRRVNSNEDSVVNSLFVDLLQKSMYIHDYTNGAFDCSVGKLVRAWGFGFQQGQPLSDRESDSLRQYLSNDFRFDTTDTGAIILHKPSPYIEIDFNAIAQGYSVDMVSDFLSRQGIENYLIDIGGEVLARGSKPDGKPWKVGIERPSTDKFAERVVESVIMLRDKSVVTSGSYRKYYEKDGARYSHTIDPATGRPVNHNLLSASVIADEAWLADALATAFMVMGLDSAKVFIDNHPEIEGAFFIYDDEGVYNGYVTPEFQALMTSNKSASL